MKYKIEWQDIDGYWWEDSEWDLESNAFAELVIMDDRDRISHVPKRIVRDDGVVTAYGRYLPKGTD